MSDVVFRDFQHGDQDSCLAIFDANCPEFFAPNEREDYVSFLESNPRGYEVTVSNGALVAAFGVLSEGDGAQRLNWILLQPDAQGLGLGTAIMARSTLTARVRGAETLHIAASHKSAPFFERFGAQRLVFTEHGWGPDMHRVDMALRL